MKKILLTVAASVSVLACNKQNEVVDLGSQTTTEIQLLAQNNEDVTNFLYEIYGGSEYAFGNTI